LANPKLKFLDFKNFAVLRVNGQNKMMRNCLNVGLELKYRFSAQLCRRQNYWFDDCSPINKSFAHIKFDPILRGYTVEKYLLLEKSAAKENKETLNTYEKSLSSAAISQRFYYSILGEGKERFGVYPLYLRVQAKIYCNERYNSTLGRIAKFVSLGLLTLGSYESEWENHSIKPINP
jgi:hypothetical protein